MGIISDDERMIRRGLREFGFNDENFHNPKYDKNELVVWDHQDKERILLKVKDSWSDNGMVLYDFTTLDGENYGSRIPESETKEPNTIEYVRYYKKQGMLDVHLFNNFIPTSDGIPSLENKLALLEAFKGTYGGDYQRAIEYNEAAQKTEIDLTSHFNCLAMLASNKKAPLKLPTETPSISEIKEMEQRAINNIKLTDEMFKIIDEIKSIESDLKKIDNPDLDELVNSEIFWDSYLSFRDLNSTKFGNFYGSAHWTLGKMNTEESTALYKKIESIHDRLNDYNISLAAHDMNNQKQGELLKKLYVFQHPKESFFRGHGDYHGTKNDIDSIDDNWQEIHMANNGFRRQFYNAEILAEVSYCEGDITYKPYEDKDSLRNAVEETIDWYAEEEGREQAGIDEKLKLNEILSIEDEINTQLDDIIDSAETTQDLNP